MSLWPDIPLWITTIIVLVRIGQLGERRRHEREKHN